MKRRETPRRIATEILIKLASSPKLGVCHKVARTAVTQFVLFEAKLQLPQQKFLQNLKGESQFQCKDLTVVAVAWSSISFKSLAVYEPI